MDEGNIPPDDHICEACGEPAELHITDIDKAGQASVRHVCYAHQLGAAALAKMSEEARAELEEMAAEFQAKRSEWQARLSKRRRASD